MNHHIAKLQREMGMPSQDGIRGPLTNAAIIRFADTGRLQVIAPTQPLINVTNEDDIPVDGDKILAAINQTLADVIREASLTCPVPFTVIEGLRSKERQAMLVASGASKTQNSRHLTGHAADLWPLDLSGKRLPAGTKAAEARLWADLRVIASHVKAAAKKLGVLIEWGGDWGWDAPHFQLNRVAYP